MRRFPILAVLGLVLLGGCQHREPEILEPAKAPPSEEPHVEPFPVQPPPPLPSLESLAGRVICLDPGHGGQWPGAVAPSNGLRENDINLRVALRLRDRLEEAGATVIMTRTDDRALHPEILSEDLSARARLANQEGADVFVSIHHNAYIDPSVEMNDLEVYYQLGDDGPSLDVAQALTYGLTRWFRQDADNKRLLPGNYRVLREAEVPAVLTEAAYLTHAPMAAYLMTDEAVEAQTEALAAGLAGYFDLDPPRAAQVRIAETADGLRQSIEVRFARGMPLDPRSVEVAVNGEPKEDMVQLSADGVRWTFGAPLPNGEHQVELRARNGKGAAVAVPLTVSVDRPPVTLTARQLPELAPINPDVELLFEVHALDTLGMPVADGVEISVTGKESTLQIHDGLARLYLFARDIRGPITFRAGGAEVTKDPRFGGSELRTLRCLDALSGRPVPEAIAVAEGQPFGVTTSEGWLAVPEEYDTIDVIKRGYEPLTVRFERAHSFVEMQPVAHGAVQGRRIVVDAAHGGRDPGRIGVHGSRASDLNLDVARRVAALLREAGALVLLTRDGDTELTPMQRLLLAEAHEPEVLITISYGMHRQESRLLDDRGSLLRAGLDAFAAHYPGSTNGMRLARALGDELGRRVIVTPAVAYLIQQTSCPSVLIQPASVERSEVEAVYRDVGMRRRDAEALYRGLVNYFAE